MGVVWGCGGVGVLYDVICYCTTHYTTLHYPLHYTVNEDNWCNSILCVMCSFSRGYCLMILSYHYNYTNTCDYMISLDYRCSGVMVSESVVKVYCVSVLRQ